MVDRIIVKPEEVRAGGNILSPAKSSSDYSLYNASITESTDTVDEQSMTVYSLAYSSPTPTPVPASLSLTSNKSILSAADSESASLTATVLDEDSEPLSGQTVTMGVYKQSDDRLVESLSVTDVGDGTYTASYLGIGAGDLYIKAECSLLTKTCRVYDYVFYDSATDNSKSARYGSIIPLEKSTVNGTFSYDTTNNCWKLQAGAISVDGLPILPLANKSDFKLTVDLMVTGTSNTSGGLFVGQYNQGLDYQMANGGAYNYLKHNYGGSNTILQASGGIFNDWFTLELTYTNGTVTARYLQGNTVILTDTSNIAYTPTTFGISFGYTANGSPVYFKNVKVEPL